MLPQPMNHQFTPADVAPAQLDTLQPFIDQLMAMPTDTPEALKSFLKAWNEYDAWVVQYIKDVQLETQTNTDNEEAQTEWMRIVSELIPKLTEWAEALGQKLLAADATEELKASKFGPYIEQTRNGVEMFREANIPLQAKVSELTNEYTKISGSWLVEFRGEKYPVPAMSKFNMDPDRATRQEAWEATRKATSVDADQLDELFTELLGIRSQIAENAGFDNFRDYIFQDKMRDYGPEECYAYHELVKAEVVPVAKAIAANLKDKLGVDTLRPWDGAADPDGGAPLSPFEKAVELQDGVERMFRRLDPELGEQFHLIREFQDLESRPAKAPGGFMATLPWKRRPFIFANASGVHSDIVTLLHEAGHAFHNILAVDNQPMWGTSVPMEFNEVASMSMELLAYSTLDEFYDDADQKRAIQQHLRRIPRLLLMVALGDEFQHWLYTNPNHTAEDRHAKWLELDKAYSTGTDWSGLNEDYRRKSWHSILHFFHVPFYFIEYGFAQIGSLQIAMNAEKDLSAALADYKTALSLGPQRDTFGLYKAAGADFIPTQEKLRSLMDWVRTGLEL